MSSRQVFTCIPIQGSPLSTGTSTVSSLESPGQCLGVGINAFRSAKIRIQNGGPRCAGEPSILSQFSARDGNSNVHGFEAVVLYSSASVLRLCALNDRVVVVFPWLAPVRHEC